jgi:nitrogen fixation protein FixH
MMSSLHTHAGGGARRRPRELTGRTVLLCLVAFFAVVAAVNAVMMTAAVTTFSGVETKNAYQAGVTFAREEAAAEAQESRHWRVNSSLLPQANGLTQVGLSAQDRAGQPLAGLEATVSLIHPNDRRLDRPVAMQASAPGHFRGTVTPSPGQWDLVIELSRDGERLFRSKERIILR